MALEIKIHSLKTTHYLPLATPSLKILAPHRQSSHWRMSRELLSPAGTCDVRGVMLHLGPGPSKQTGLLPPWMFPRGIPSAALPVAVTSALRPVQLPRQSHVRLVITRILRPPHPARPAGRRCPPAHGSAPLHRPPEEAPRPGLRHRVSCLTPCLRPPQDSRRDALGLRFGNVVRVGHIGGSRGHLRALRRQVLSSSPVPNNRHLLINL